MLKFLDELVDDLGDELNLGLAVLRNLTFLVEHVPVLVIESVHHELDLHVSASFIDTLLLYEIPDVRKFDKCSREAKGVFGVAAFLDYTLKLAAIHHHGLENLLTVLVIIIPAHLLQDFPDSMEH